MKFKTFFAVAMFFTFSNVHAQNITWRKGDFSVQLQKNKIAISYQQKPLLGVSSFNFNFTAPSKISIASNTSDSLVLHFSYPPHAKYNDEKGEMFADISISVVNNSLRFFSKPSWAKNTTIVIKHSSEHYFGVVEQLQPDNKKTPDLIGKTVDVNPIGNSDQFHENYTSVWSAFYMTNKGYASFFDSYANGKYVLGVNGATELYHQTGNLDWYIIPGNNGDEILKKYYAIIGKPKFVPLWACGVSGWRDDYKGGKDQILSDVQHMTDLKIPFTAWMLDRPYSDGANNWSKMNFNSKFSHPEQWIKQLNDNYGLQFMTWIGSLTFEDKDFPALLPNYKNYIDLTNPAGVNEFEKRLRENQYSVNVRGHKMDRAEEDFPETSDWFEKTPEPERRAKYLFLYSKKTDEFLRHAFGDDEFNFTRGAYHRCQPYLSAVWSGDSRCSWDGLQCTVANGVRAGFLGFPMWGSDVGGYLAGRPSEKLYARWLQLGTWSGMDEIKLDDLGGRGEDRMPWKYSQSLQDIFKDACSLRMQLQPYVYSLANTSYKNGVIMKPLAYVYPNDAKTYGIWDEYFFGKSFLIAPILDSTDKRNVYLPAGEWYDLDHHHSEVYHGNQTITITMPIDKTPVFIKSNTIFAEGVLMKGNAKNWNTKAPAIELFYIAPAANGSASFDYVDYFDANKEKVITASRQGRQISIRTPPIKNAKTFFVRLNAKPKAVLLNQKQIDFQWSTTDEIVMITLTDSQNEIKITL